MRKRSVTIVMFTGFIIGTAFFLALGLWVIQWDPVWVAIFWAVVWGIVLVVTVVAFIFFLRESDPRLARGNFQMVPTTGTALPPPTDRTAPWPDELLAPAVALAFADLPYQVLTDGHTVMIHSDLHDAELFGTVERRRQVSTFVVRLWPTGTPGEFKRADESRRLEIRDGALHLGAQLSVQSGRQWRISRSTVFRRGPKGWTKTQDESFSTGDINQPLRKLFQRAGWKSLLDAESRGALVVGIFGASAILLVPLGFLLKNTLS